MTTAYFVQSDLTGAFDLDVFNDQLQSLHQTDVEPLRARAQSSPNMTVAIQASTAQSFYKAPFLSGVPINYAGGNSPTLTAPSTNPRIALIHIDASNVIGVTYGSEAGSPVAPTYPTDKFPICEVYMRVGMTTIVNNEVSGANPTQGYIYKDSRPKMVAGGISDHGALTGLSDDDHTIYALLLGRSGGQVLKGGTAANNDLEFQSTSHATKGECHFSEGRLKFGDAAADPGAAGEFFRNGANIKFHDGSAVRTLLHSGSSLGGDVTGTLAANTVEKLRNRTVHTTAPAEGDGYAWDNANSRFDIRAMYGAGALASSDSDVAINQDASNWVDIASITAGPHGLLFFDVRHEFVSGGGDTTLRVIDPSSNQLTVHITTLQLTGTGTGTWDMAASGTTALVVGASGTAGQIRRIQVWAKAASAASGTYKLQGQRGNGGGGAHLVRARVQTWMR